MESKIYLIMHNIFFYCFDGLFSQARVDISWWYLSSYDIDIFFASSSWVGYIIFSIICSVMMKERVIGNNTSKCFCPSPCWTSFLFTLRKDKFLTNWHCQYQRIRKRNYSQRKIYELMWLNNFKKFWYILLQLSIITIYYSTTLYKK